MANKNKTVKACDFKCDMCKKGKHDTLTNIGTSVGDGQDLAANIAGGPDKQDSYIKGHTLYSTLRNSSKGNPIAELQAHHLICTESMDDEGKAPAGGHTWEDLCNRFGYNINDKENGVFLPSNLSVACSYKVPLHKGGHSATETDANYTNYVEAVKKKISSLKQNPEIYCNNPAKFKEKLDKISSDIFDNLKDFTWTITIDGKDYDYSQGTLGIGCMNYTTLEEKNSKYLDLLTKDEKKQATKIKKDNGLKSPAVPRKNLAIAKIQMDTTLWCNNIAHRLTPKYDLKISE